MHFQYINTTLSRMGYNKIWLIVLQYGDCHFCELQLRHFEPVSLIRKINLLRLQLLKPTLLNLYLL